MKKFSMSILLLLIVIFYPISHYSQESHPEPKTLEPGSKAPDFNLLGVDGKRYSLNDFTNAKVLVVIFSCNHCPTAQAYEQRIIDLSNDYKPKGVSVAVISSNSGKALNYSELGYTDMGDSYDEMKVRANERHFPYPYLYDGDDQTCALVYGPSATPHAFVFDKDRTLRYTGRIDRSEKPGTGHAEDIRNAIDAVLNGEQVKNPVTKVFGCSIKWSWKSEYTQRLYKQWSELPVTLESIDIQQVNNLIKNDSSGKLRLINIWATWCGPCVTEFPDLVIIDRMYRQRPFEFITISVDKQERRTDVLNFLKENEASNKNYIFNDDDVYKLIDVISADFKGLPYTLLIEPGGKIIYHKSDMIDPYQMKKLIVEDKLLGRYY
ncbi:MAG: redoxin family protein [Bacteroidota bacterium]|nr:redoxin family protein [Bacteroidota bacterium]